MRGGERVLELLCRLFPQACIFTLFHHKGSVSRYIEEHPIVTSRLQKVPFSKKNYRYLLPLFPGAVESFDLTGFDVVISTSHAVAKGAIPPRDAVSICYCHTPMRYVWDQYDVYFNAQYTSPLIQSIMPLFRDYLQSWDVSTQNRVHYYIANSRFVADRIHRLYQRDSHVIPAPVDCSFYTPDDSEPEDFYLMVSALAPYKRVDLAIDAFNASGRKLVIIGDGTESKNLRRTAGSNIRFLGRLSDRDVRDYYRRCRALIFPGIEDFGLVPLEAQACGRPVIAFAGGGALETIVEGVGGHFFFSQTIQSLNYAVDTFEKMTFSSEIIRKRSFQFDAAVIENRLKQYLNSILKSRELPVFADTEESQEC